MLGAKAALFVALAVLAAIFLGVWMASVRRARRGSGPPGLAAEVGPPTALQGAIGFVVTFFDTLGIGSFATTTSIFKLRRVVPDQLIPGTLNVGITLPTVAQAFIYILIVKADMRTLALMIAAAVAGAWLGAGVVAGWPRRNIQIGMGIALVLAAALMLGTQLRLFPAGGDALGVTGVRLAVALAANFALGALMTLGIGLYAPCMILVSLLGMNPTVAFPIMMGSCAFLMPVASMRFIQKKSYALRAAIGLALAGIPAVLLAAYVVKSLPLGAVRWLVVCVVLYTAVAMLRSAKADRLRSAPPVAPVDALAPLPPLAPVAPVDAVAPVDPLAPDRVPPLPRPRSG
jgi:uncharacterized membrane protein YfcA